MGAMGHESILRRIDRKTVVTATGCWEWQGARDKNGYGLTFYGSNRLRKVTILAHRLVYELMVGPIPEGLGLDHLCRNPPCVRPEHLEPVTQVENTHRSPLTVNSINKAKTECLRGHSLLDPANVYTAPSRPYERVCRKCLAIRKRKWKARKRESA